MFNEPSERDRLVGLARKNRGTPLPPPLTGIIELARNSRQNPHGKGVRYHNIENKWLTVWRFRLLRTVTASTMIARLRHCAQGQMSQMGVWKFLDGLWIDAAVRPRRGSREIGDEGERPDTPGPPDRRGRLSPHELLRLTPSCSHSPVCEKLIFQRFSSCLQSEHSSRRSGTRT